MKTTINAVAITLAFAGSLFSQTITSRTVDIPFSLVISGVCEDEPVALTGSVQINWKRTDFPDGMVRIDSRSMLKKGEGTGLITGVKYNLQEKFTDTVTFSSAGIIGATYKHQLRVIGPGPDNDMFITYIQKQEGDVFVVDDFKGVCK